VGLSPWLAKWRQRGGCRGSNTSLLLWLYKTGRRGGKLPCRRGCDFCSKRQYERMMMIQTGEKGGKLWELSTADGMKGLKERKHASKIMQCFCKKRRGLSDVCLHMGIRQKGRKVKGGRWNLEAIGKCAKRKDMVKCFHI